MDGSAIDTLSLPVYPLLYQPPITYRYLLFDTYISLIPGLEGKPTLDLAPYINPVKWSKTSKGFTLCLSYIAATSSTYAAGSYSPLARAILEEWHISIVKILLSITTFYTRYIIASIVFAPFSEIKGRYPVFLGTRIIYLSA
jgi:hypothetical protein